MKTEKKKQEPIVFSPDLRADDALANYWMRQATIRLRREVMWLWQERGVNAPEGGEQLPLFADKLSASLDLSRYWAEKRKFFETDVTGKYLSDKLAAKPPKPKNSPRGSFGWVVGELSLDDAETFALALGLTSAFDASVGSVIAACLNDNSKTFPNLMLVQKLWDKPEEILALADPQNPLFGYGLLVNPAGNNFRNENFWESPLTVPPLVARQLLSAKSVETDGLAPLDKLKIKEKELSDTERLIAYRLKTEKAEKLQVVALLGAKGTDFGETVGKISAISGRTVYRFSGNTALLQNANYFNSLAALGWLQDFDLFIEPEMFGEDEKHRSSNDGLPLTSLPVTLFTAISERRQIKHIEPEFLFPIVKIPSLDYEERVEFWKKQFGRDASKYEQIIKEIARRFRYEKNAIREICAELKALPEKLKDEDFIAACRTKLHFDIGELASPVTPRFKEEKLILPHKQTLQFEEQIQAMKSLTKVHYEWGTARAWNEGGITVLFAGPPGTGKTMAAEVMAIELDLPMFRVDLSQVVDKYIGETEKNLKRIFDAADISDMVLFFDEADSLFGKRTEVSDSRDRMANMEISYLLERMERFKGLAILATNRKRDLDEAFMRRLRYIIDFSLPEEAQRKQIWQQMIPKNADGSELDLDFLARQFPLSGGHIRSIIFNACLRSAHSQNGTRKLPMSDILIAVKREYDKMNRAVSLEQFGNYAAEIAKLEQ